MGPSIWQLLIVLVIVILLFGTKRLKNIGSDLGGALKGFKKAVDDGSKKTDESLEDKKDADMIDADVIEGEVIKEKEKEKVEK